MTDGNGADSGRIPVGRTVLFAVIALGGAAFDLATKWFVFRSLGPQGSPPRELVPDMLELRTSHNSGALWGFMANVEHSSLVFAVLSLLAVAGILYWLFWRGAAAGDRLLTVALGLIMAGALGNCYDRLVFGYVRDFVHFYVEPVGFDCAIFNFADNMLVIGALMLMLMALRPEPVPQPASEQPQERVEEIPAAPPAP